MIICYDCDLENSGSSNGRTLNVLFRSLWVQIPPTVFMVLWCNGSTSDFLSENEGSTPFRTNTKHAWSGSFPCMETSLKHLEVGLIVSAEIIIRTKV